MRVGHRQLRRRALARGCNGWGYGVCDRPVGHRQFEAVAEPRNGTNRAGAKDASQAGYLCRQVVFIDNNPGPHPLEQHGLVTNRP